MGNHERNPRMAHQRIKVHAAAAADARQMSKKLKSSLIKYAK